jgi:hypothetical protein
MNLMGRRMMVGSNVCNEIAKWTTHDNLRIPAQRRERDMVNKFC